MSRWLVPGVLVAVTFDPMSQIPNHAARKYNGTIHRIRSKKAYGSPGFLYTLWDAASDKGVYYSFLESDLMEVQ